MAASATTLQVAVDLPVRGLLSYRSPQGIVPEAGVRVKVPVQSRTCTGLVIAADNTASSEKFKLKAISEQIDTEPLLNPAMMKLLGWCADYYLHPPGEVFMGALPAALRGDRKCPDAKLPPQETASATEKHELNNEQLKTVQAVNAKQPYLLEGVTGSGKTEVYMELIAKAMQEGKQSLLLLPEIGLTPQNLERLRQRFQCPVAVIHSGRTRKQRLEAWLAARAGLVPLVVGTRSALWTPLDKPGLIVVDEEHDHSFKQQDGFRYMARDVAVMRARIEKIPIVLGSATPSLESLFNAHHKRYTHLKLSQRAGSAKLPTMRVMDIRNCRMHGAISEPLVQTMRATIERKRQVLLFLGRRGYSPILLCHLCGSRENCDGCDRAMTLHRYPAPAIMRCHLCGRTAPPPTKCGKCEAPMITVGHGTQRIEETLKALFPDTTVLRFDRDQTRRKGEMQNLLQQAHCNDSCIMVGTQMIAKGHHLPKLELVGIIDIDRALYSHNFRGMEIAAQQIIQVAGRAGRGDNAGQVILQTHHPEHPFIGTLISDGYSKFASNALAEREQVAMPPFTRMALLQAESKKTGAAHSFLQTAMKLMPEQKEVNCFGPMPVIVEKRAGFLREHIVITAPRTGILQKLLGKWIPQIATIKRGSGIRWFIDIDPLENC